VKFSVLARAYGYEQLRDGWLRQALGFVLSAIPPIRDRVGGGVDYLRGESRGRLLDVGCGSGLFLYRMKQLGWDVLGVDPDPAAAAFARDRYGIHVEVGDFSDVPVAPGSFDAITLNHVIEHVHDPIGVIRRCGTLLKPHGRCVMIPPNVDSLGHQEHRKAWLPLDPPRHLMLFSAATLSHGVRAAGLTLERALTTARSAAAMWSGSESIAQTSRGSVDADATLRFHPKSLWFQLREELACQRGSLAGEELIVFATRGAARERAGGRG